MKTFTNHIDNINATDDQKDLANALDQFFASGNSAFLMLGYAGTGKTFMLDQLAHYLKLNNTPFLLMAPTGRAAKVLASRTGLPANTVHRSIYRMDNLKEYKEKNQDGSETYKYYFELAVNNDDANAVYIVDEASMVSDLYSEGEFFRFGSGHLLNDLLSYANPQGKAIRRKIIFCGDPAQLPPVGSPHSPALNETILKSEFGMHTKAFEMQQVVRQRAESGILTNATELRKSISTKLYNSFSIRETDEVTPINSSVVLNAWLDARRLSSPEQTMIVAFSNRQVKDYNDIIREHLFPGTDTIQPGDRILVVRNNYSQDFPLLNGDFGEVMAVADHIDNKTVYINKPVNGKRVNVSVDLCFRRVTLRFDAPEGGMVDVNCLINENLLNSPDPTLSSDECKALYVDFKERNPGLKAGTAEFKEALRTDARFNSLQIKYGYAVTCHKAQGGEWEHVFADFASGQNHFSEFYYRWAYTAMTRAKGHLYAMNAPCFSRLTARRPIDTETVENIATRVLRIPQDAMPIPFDMPRNAPWLASLYYAVESHARGNTLRITALRHRHYAEDYTFTSASGESFSTQIYYNNMHTITRVLPAGDVNPKQQQQVDDLAASLTGYRLIAPTEPVIEHSLNDAKDTAGEDHQAIFCHDLKAALLDDGITLLNVTHNPPYHTTCHFARQDERAVIHYYFNRHACLNRVIPDNRKSTCPHLIKTILQCSQPQGASHAV